MSDSDRGFDDVMPAGRGRADQGPDPETPLDVARGIVRYLNSDDCEESSGNFIQALVQERGLVLVETLSLGRFAGEADPGEFCGFMYVLAAEPGQAPFAVLRARMDSEPPGAPFTELLRVDTQ